MSGHILQMDHSSVEFDFESADTVAASFADAVHDLAARAALSGGSVAWSTLGVDVNVATVTDQRITERHARVSVGRSTLTVSANIIYNS